MKTLEERITSTIWPTDVKVFYESNRPYVHYKGKVRTPDGEFNVEIPKMSMELHAIDREIDEFFYDCTFGGREGISNKVTVASRLYCESDVYMNLTPVKVRMTKKQVEKKLGYKVDIVDDCDNPDWL